MTIDKERVRLLQSMDLKRLTSEMQQASEEVSQAANDLLGYEQDNRAYITARGQDCQAVQERLAVLATEAPRKREDGKATTVADREAWLQRQRQDDELLAQALARQAEVAYEREHKRQVVEDAKRRHGDRRAVLTLRTAQIGFLSLNEGGE